MFLKSLTLEATTVNEKGDLLEFDASLLHNLFEQGKFSIGSFQLLNWQELLVQKRVFQVLSDLIRWNLGVTVEYYTLQSGRGVVNYRELLSCLYAMRGSTGKNCGLVLATLADVDSDIMTLARLGWATESAVVAASDAQLMLKSVLARIDDNSSFRFLIASSDMEVLNSYKKAWLAYNAVRAESWSHYESSGLHIFVTVEGSVYACDCESAVLDRATAVLLGDLRKKAFHLILRKVMK